MNFWTQELIRSQLRAMSEAATDEAAWDLFLDHRQCCVRTCELVQQNRGEGMSVREAAKKAVGAL